MPTTPQLTKQQQKRLWENRFFAEVRSYYFADLATIYLRKQRALTWTMLILSSGALVGLVAQLPKEFAWVPLLLAFASSALSYQR